MEKRKILRTEKFRRSFKKLPGNIKKGFDKQIKKLEDPEVNSYGIGDPLGYRWFRELKQDKFRLYFISIKMRLLYCCWIRLIRKHKKKQ